MPSTAEEKRRYREYRKSIGDPVPSGKSGKSGRTKSKFRDGSFIAWDGEGINTGRMIDEFTEEHYLTMFAASTGAQIVAEPGERLSTMDCFALLLETAVENPGAIHVVYGGSYDMNHILRDLTRDQARELARTGELHYNGVDIRYMQRKSLQLVYGEISVTLWDVIGFFQTTFVNCVEQWLGKDYPTLPLIREGKHKRQTFADADTNYMLEYNRAELSTLVALMEKFREAVSALGLTLARWDGAGAVAAAILRKQDYKRHIRVAPKDVEMAGRHAYFGGRFELGKFGAYDGAIYGYDINSAYPTIFRDLPSLMEGRWIKRRNPQPETIKDFGLYLVNWELDGLRFGPFPFRNPFGLVSFPTEGKNWIWGSELNAYLRYVDSRPLGETANWLCDIQMAYEFESYETRPFGWIEEYYEERKRIVNGTSALPYGCQMVIKLGLNSLYGKTAQSLGYEPESKRIPPYHNLLYAGFITASTRAKLWEAAMQKPDDIVMMATDGLLSTQELDLDVSKDKVLGKWEFTEYNYCLSIQSGVYVTREGDKWKFRKRGIDSVHNVPEFVETVISHWGKRKQTFAPLPMQQTRLITIKSAVISDAFWARWGSWYHQPHDLVTEPGASTKRQRDNASPNGYPSKGFVNTVPTPNLWYIADPETQMSIPYERPWDREGWLWEQEEELYELLDATEYASG